MRRKRPLADLTPEEDAEEAPVSPERVAGVRGREGGDITEVVVEATPSYECVVCTIDNPVSACSR